MATLSPASERRFAAQPPEAPEPTTKTSKFVGESGVGICAVVAIVKDRDAGFYEMDANKRSESRQRKKMNFMRAKVLLDACSEWYHRRRNSKAEVLTPGRLARSSAAPVHDRA